MKTLKSLILASVLGLGGGNPVGAQEFDISFGPLKVGQLLARTEVAEGHYSADLTIRTTGLAAAARPVRFSGKAKGQVRSWPRPARYREEIDTGRRVSSAELVWQGQSPEVAEYTADPAETVPPAATQARKGAIDPASAVFAALTGAPFCGQSLLVFDGQRLNSITFAAGQTIDTGLTCKGRLTRLAGYPARDLEERPGLDLSLVYATDGDALRLVEAEVQTLYGKLRLKQR